MRLLIFSDNHRDRKSVKKMLEDNLGMDRIFSLGDSEMREQELSELNIVGVKGNYPFEPNFPHDLLFNFDGVNILFTHGHKYGVKMGISRLIRKAHSVSADIVCFGHTHSKYLKDLHDVIYLNPGSLAKPKMGDNASYATIEITIDSIIVRIIRLSDKEVLKEYKKTR